MDIDNGRPRDIMLASLRLADDFFYSKDDKNSIEILQESKNLFNGEAYNSQFSNYFLMAAQKGYSGTIKYLLNDFKQNDNIQLTENDISMALEISCLKGYLEVVKPLMNELKQNKRFHISNKCLRVSLAKAAFSGNLALTKFLLDEYKQIDNSNNVLSKSNVLNKTAIVRMLEHSSKKGDIEVAKLILNELNKYCQQRIDFKYMKNSLEKSSSSGNVEHTKLLFIEFSQKKHFKINKSCVRNCILAVSEEGNLEHTKYLIRAFKELEPMKKDKEYLNHIIRYLHPKASPEILKMLLEEFKQDNVKINNIIANEAIYSFTAGKNSKALEVLLTEFHENDDLHINNSIINNSLSISAKRNIVDIFKVLLKEFHENEGLQIDNTMANESLVTMASNNSSRMFKEYLKEFHVNNQLQIDDVFLNRALLETADFPGQKDRIEILRDILKEFHENSMLQINNNEINRALFDSSEFIRFNSRIPRELFDEINQNPNLKLLNYSVNEALKFAATTENIEFLDDILESISKCDDLKIHPESIKEALGEALSNGIEDIAKRLLREFDSNKYLELTNDDIRVYLLTILSKRDNTTYNKANVEKDLLDVIKLISNQAIDLVSKEYPEFSKQHVDSIARLKNSINNSNKFEDFYTTNLRNISNRKTFIHEELGKLANNLPMSINEKSLNEWGLLDVLNNKKDNKFIYERPLSKVVEYTLDQPFSILYELNKKIKMAKAEKSIHESFQSRKRKFHFLNNRSQKKLTIAKVNFSGLY